jgi:hypothetical protein
VKDPQAELSLEDLEEYVPVQFGRITDPLEYACMQYKQRNAGGELEATDSSDSATS